MSTLRRFPQPISRLGAALVVLALSMGFGPVPVVETATPADLATAMAGVDVQKTVLRVRLRPEEGALDVEGAVTLLARQDGVERAPMVLAEAFGRPEFRVDG